MLNRRNLTAALLLAPGVAWSQASAARGPNGGIVVVAQGHPLELLVDNLTVTIFLTDERGRPEATRGATGRLVIQTEGRTITVALAPAEPNRLIGTVEAPLGAGARVAFNAVMPDGHRLQARYTLE